MMESSGLSGAGQEDRRGALRLEEKLRSKGRMGENSGTGSITPAIGVLGQVGSARTLLDVSAGLTVGGWGLGRNDNSAALLLQWAAGEWLRDGP